MAALTLFIKYILIVSLLCFHIKYSTSRLLPSYDEVLHFKEDLSFPTFSQLGQISGLATDKDGKLHIFHRCGRLWDSGTFNHNYRLNDETPIPNNTIVVIDPLSGAELYSWGSDLFYMPHGIFIDEDGNTWITDVALHQVLKFSPHETKPSLTIGKKFESGNSPYHLCQPTDVVATKSGYVFVSDGYCNARIIMYNLQGKPLQDIGASDRMLIPHSLALVPEYEAICVADRENRRILCYSSGLSGNMPPGILLGEIQESSLGRIFAIRQRGKQLLAVSGPDFHPNNNSPQGMVFDIATGYQTASFEPSGGFSNPHDLALTSDGKYVFVGDLDVTKERRLYKFKIED